MSPRNSSQRTLPQKPLSHGGLLVGAGRPARSAAIAMAGRGVGAGLLLGMAWIHWHLYHNGFDSIPKIGPAFYANAVLGVLAAAAVLLAPSRWLAVVASGAALLLAGTLAALGLSFTVGLFGFKESSSAPFLPATVIVEALGTLELAWLAYAHRRPLVEVVRRFRGRPPWRAGLERGVV